MKVSEKFLEHPITSAIIAAGIIAFVGYVWTEFRSHQSPKDLYEKYAWEVLRRTSGAEALLRNPCVPDRDRVNEAWLMLNEPANGSKFQLSTWFGSSLVAQDEPLEKLIQHLLEISKTHDVEDVDLLYKPRNLPKILAATRFMTDTFSASAMEYRSSALPSNESKVRFVAEQRNRFLEQLLEAFRSFYRLPIDSDDWENENKRFIRRESLEHNLQSPLAAQVMSEANVFDTAFDAPWWKVCRDTAAKYYLALVRYSVLPQEKMRREERAFYRAQVELLNTFLNRITFDEKDFKSALNQWRFKGVNLKDSSVLESARNFVNIIYPLDRERLVVLAEDVFRNADN